MSCAGVVEAEVSVMAVMDSMGRRPQMVMALRVAISTVHRHQAMDQDTVLLEVGIAVEISRGAEKVSMTGEVISKDPATDSGNPFQHIFVQAFRRLYL